MDYQFQSILLPAAETASYWVVEVATPSSASLAQLLPGFEGNLHIT